MLACFIKDSGHMGTGWSLSIGCVFGGAGDPTRSFGAVKVALSEVADLQSTRHSDSPALAF
jgi:hypothetical protein